MNKISLLDIAPIGKTVEINGSLVEVFGLSAKAISNLLVRFEPVRNLLGGTEIAIGDVMGLGGEIVGAIIAAGVGKPGDSQYEEHAAGLDLGIQADLIKGILEATMPGGLAPFVEKLSSVQGALKLLPEQNTSDSAALSPKTQGLNGAASIGSA